MKTLMLAVILLPIFSQAQKTTIPQGTIVTIQLMQDISSKHANEGDIIDFITTEPIIINDSVVIAPGAKVTGKVTDCDRAKGLGKAGKLNFSVDYLYTASGKVVKLSTEQKTNGNSKVGAAVAEAILLSPLFLLKKGKNIKFDKGHIFKAFVDKDVTL